MKPTDNKKLLFNVMHKQTEQSYIPPIHQLPNKYNFRLFKIVRCENNHFEAGQLFLPSFLPLLKSSRRNPIPSSIPYFVSFRPTTVRSILSGSAPFISIIRWKSNFKQRGRRNAGDASDSRNEHGGHH